MTDEAAANPNAVPPPAEPPTPAEVLRAVAALSPTLWFPSEHARQGGADRDGLDEPIRILKRTALIHVVDWVKGRGQGYGLTALGREVLADSDKLTSLRDGKFAPTEPVLDDPDLVVHPQPTTSEQPETVKKKDDGRPTTLTPYERGELAREAFLSPKAAIVTPVLLAVNIVWFLVGLYLVGGDSFAAKEYLRGADLATEVRLGAAFGPHLMTGEWWRLLTAGFVHFGLLHLVANMLALAMLGPFAEGLLSRWRFLAVYLLCGVAGMAAAVANNPGSAVAGASASNWGLMLAVIAWILRYREHLPAPEVADAMRQLGFAVLVNAVVSFIPGVSWEGHFAGGVAGFLGAGLLDMVRRDRGRRRMLVGAAGLAVFLALCVGGFLAVVRYGEKWQAYRSIHQILHIPPERLALIQTLVPASPGIVEHLHKSASVAMLARLPKGLKDTREATDQLDRHVNEVFPTAPEPAKPYLAKVREFCRLLKALLAADRAPDPGQSQALATLVDEIHQEWKATSHLWTSLPR